MWHYNSRYLNKCTDMLLMRAVSQLNWDPSENMDFALVKKAKMSDQIFVSTSTQLGQSQTREYLLVLWRVTVTLKQRVMLSELTHWMKRWTSRWTDSGNEVNEWLTHLMIISQWMTHSPDDCQFALTDKQCCVPAENGCVHTDTRCEDPWHAWISLFQITLTWSFSATPFHNMPSAAGYFSIRCQFHPLHAYQETFNWMFSLCSQSKRQYKMFRIESQSKKQQAVISVFNI